jgi:hypothetical protein
MVAAGGEMAAALLRCTVPGCGQTAVLDLQDGALCVDHFLEDAFAQSAIAQQLCEMALPVGEELLDGLFRETQSAGLLLLNEASDHQITQREKILEFLLCVANLYEYAARHPVQAATQIN